MTLQNNRKALVIASHFPPNKRVGGVIRIAKFAKFLPDYNWDSFVITVKHNESDEFDRLLSDLNSNCIVYRLPELDIRKPILAIFNFFYFFKSSKKNKATSEGESLPISSFYFIPDHLFFWTFLASLKGIFTCFLKKIDVIYATSPMQSGLICGLIIKLFTRVPLIIELRDPWTTNPFHIKKKYSLLNKFEEKLELYTFLKADIIIVINQYFITTIIDKYPQLSREKFVVIENGFDDDDFKSLIPKKFKKKTLIHAGNFYLGRSPRNFLEALAVSCNTYPELMSEWEVIFVGSAENFQALVEELNLTAIVKFSGTVPHSESISFLLGADALLLIPGKGRTTLTGKIFEYIAAKKPIFVISGESAAADLVHNLELGIHTDEHNINEISENFFRFLNKFVPSFEFKITQENKLKVFERKYIVGECVSVMNRLVKIQK